MKMLHDNLTERVIKAFYEVYNTLGYGFLEKVYENAMVLELQKGGLKVVQQAPIHVFYNGQIIGDYFADLLIEEKVIVELKSTKTISNEHIAQILNYLKATNIEVGLILNFGPRPQVKRKVYDNHLK